MPVSLQNQLQNLGINISPQFVAKEIAFVEELMRWNKKINLTAITDRDEVLEKHLLDSLVLNKFLKEDVRLLDLGSGGGFPGLALAIANPEIRVVSVESVGKKVNFQKHIKRLFSLDNFEPVGDRIENLLKRGDFKSEFDIITARAFASLEAIVEMSGPFLSTHGKIIAMKGPEGDAELAAMRKEKLKNFRDISIECYKLPLSGSKRRLIVLQK